MKLRIVTLLVVLTVLGSLPLGAEIILEEGFESGTTPAGWSQEFITGNTSWEYQSGGYLGNPPSAHSGNFNAILYYGSFTANITRLITPELNLGTSSDGELTFWHTQELWVSDQDELHIYYKNSPTGNWTQIASYTGNIVNWTQEAVVLPNPSTTYYIAFEGVAQYGYGVCLDDIVISGQPVTYDFDLAAIGLVGPEVVNAGNSYIYDFTIKNVGNYAQDNFILKLLKNNSQVLFSQEYLIPIEPDEELEFGLVWNIPLDENPGTVQIRAEVEAAIDENSNNDQTADIPVTIYPYGIYEVTIGDGDDLNNRYPVSFIYKNSLTETIYYPDELAIDLGLITNVAYNNNFSIDLNDKPTRIWMGETTVNDFTDGYIPSTQLDLVYDGSVDYPGGENTVSIELDTPYLYQGENLVLLVQKPWEEINYPSSQVDFSVTATGTSNRTIYERDNTIEFDPANPPEGYLTDNIPNTTFQFFLGNLGALEGYVHDDQENPLQGAEVRIEETQDYTISDQDGYYLLSNLIGGTYSVTASLFGYSPQTQQIEIIEEETVQLDFNLIPLGSVNVSGRIVGSDDPETGLENALVSLTGFENYDVLTDEEGYFLLEGVYTNIEYDLNIIMDGYQDHYDQIWVGGEDLDLGEILLEEIALPPGNVLAQQNEAGTEVSLTWSPPGEGGGEFRYDDGDYFTDIGYGSAPMNAVFGAVHNHNAVIQEIHWYLSSTNASHNNVRLLIFGLEDGLPDSDNILYNSGTITNIDDQWNVETLSEAIEAPEGFLIGVSTPLQWTGAGLDDGSGEPWEFGPGTQYTISDYTSPGEEWVDIGTINPPMFQRNLMIRAYGIDLGELDRIHGSSSNLAEAGNSIQRSFESYNIYRFAYIYHDEPEFWDQIAGEYLETEYLDLSWGGLEPDTYQYAVTSIYTNGVESIAAFSLPVEKTTPAGNDPNQMIPYFTGLIGNHPNPFNPRTTIDYSLSEQQKVNLAIYNIRGELVVTLIDNEIIPAGKHSADWSGLDTKGRKMPSGIYFYSLTAGSEEFLRKMILIK